MKSDLSGVDEGEKTRQWDNIFKINYLLEN